MDNSPGPNTSAARCRVLNRVGLLTLAGASATGWIFSAQGAQAGPLEPSITGPNQGGSVILLPVRQGADPLAGTLQLSGAPRRTLVEPARTAASG